MHPFCVGSLSRSSLQLRTHDTVVVGVQSHSPTPSTPSLHHRAPQCTVKTPVKRDYTWVNYNNNNGFAYKNVGIKRGIFSYIYPITNAETCFKRCADTFKVSTREDPCLTFSYDVKGKKCYLSTAFIPYDSSDDPAKLQLWCPNKTGWISGWTVDSNDK